MKGLLALFAVLLAGTACRKESADAATQTAALRQQLKGVTITDGISKPEAEIIAKCYFDKHVGCGAFLGIRDGGSNWIVDAKFGLAGKPVNGFHIDKNTGVVTSPIGPSYANPSQILP